MPTVPKYLQVIILLVVIIITHVRQARAIEEYTPKLGNAIIEPWRWQTFPKLEGSGVRCMTEGIDGSLWFGVDKGVLCYDGFNWKAYTQELDSLRIYHVCATNNGDIYAAGKNRLY